MSDCSSITCCCCIKIIEHWIIVYRLWFPQTSKTWWNSGTNFISYYSNVVNVKWKFGSFCHKYTQSFLWNLSVKKIWSVYIRISHDQNSMGLFIGTWCLSFAKNIKHATYFKIANQQHQQNPVNELSCSNLYALVCFLQTYIYMRFLFMVHSVHSHKSRLKFQGIVGIVFWIELINPYIYFGLRYTLLHEYQHERANGVTFLRIYTAVGRSINVPSVLRHCWLGIRKSIQPVKNWVMRCWCGYLSGARCRLFAYGPADVTAFQNPVISCLI